MSDNRSLPAHHSPPVARSGIDVRVLAPAAALSLLFVLAGVLFTDGLAETMDSTLGWLLGTFGWLFVLSAAAFLCFVLFVAFSRFGSIRLGRDEDRPEFRTVSWIAMMFSAGMGIGLMFYGVAEPISHLAVPPLGLAEPNTQAAARLAMEYTYFHWALHPWAFYALVGLVLGYFTYRKGMPNLVSSAFHPLIGDRVHGWAGRSIDILAIFATMFGSATSLGFGALQINSGLSTVWGIEPSTGLAVGIIILLTGLFVLSAVSGVERGIQFLSNVNMLVAVLIVGFVLVLGPTVLIFGTLVEGVGDYVSGLVGRSFRTGASGGADWMTSWTIFYWVWWISWTPFVGTFLARISKGRTIREFVVGVLLVPSGVSVVWFAILGGAAIDAQLSGQADLAGVVDNPEVALFTLLAEYPMATVTAAVVIILVALFFVSGADAASIVMGMLSCRGTLEPPRLVVAMWGSLMGGVAVVLLLAGGLNSLQQAAIIVGAPMMFIMAGLAVSLMKALREDPAVIRLGPAQREPADVVDLTAADGSRAVAAARDPARGP